MTPNGLTKTLFYDMVPNFLPEYQKYQSQQRNPAVNALDDQIEHFLTQ